MIIETKGAEDFYQKFPDYFANIDLTPTHEGWGIHSSAQWQQAIDRLILKNITDEPESYEDQDQWFTLFANPWTVLNPQEKIEGVHESDQPYLDVMFKYLKITRPFTVVGLWEGCEMEAYFGYSCDDPETLVVLFG